MRGLFGNRVAASAALPLTTPPTELLPLRMHGARGLLHDTGHLMVVPERLPVGTPDASSESILAR